MRVNIIDTPTLDDNTKLNHCTFGATKYIIAQWKQLAGTRAQFYENYRVGLDHCKCSNICSD